MDLANPINYLQQICSKLNWLCPIFKEIEQEQNGLFRINCIINDIIAIGESNTKKMAKKQSAIQMINTLTEYYQFSFFVYNLQIGTTEKDLRLLISDVKSIQSIKILYDADKKGLSKAEIIISNLIDLLVAIKYNEYCYKNRKLLIKCQAIVIKHPEKIKRKKKSSKKRNRQNRKFAIDDEFKKKNDNVNENESIIDDHDIDIGDIDTGIEIGDNNIDIIDNIDDKILSVIDDNNLDDNRYYFEIYCQNEKYLDVITKDFDLIENFLNDDNQNKNGDNEIYNDNDNLDLIENHSNNQSNNKINLNGDGNVIGDDFDFRIFNGNNNGDSIDSKIIDSNVSSKKSTTKSMKKNYSNQIDEIDYFKPVDDNELKKLQQGRRNITMEELYKNFIKIKQKKWPEFQTNTLCDGLFDD